MLMLVQQALSLTEPASQTPPDDLADVDLSQLWGPGVHDKMLMRLIDFILRFLLAYKLPPSC